jgi:hypothetical protein
MAEFENPNEPSVKEIMISNPADFDPSRIVIHDPTTSKFKIGNSEISMTVSKGFYLNDEGEECKLYFQAPAQTCFGPQYQYEMGVEDDAKDPSKAKGVQVQYPITSLQSIATPTPAEQAFQNMVQGIWNVSLEKAKEEMARVPPQEEGGEEINPDDYIFIPSVSYSSFTTAAATKRWTNALKVPFEHPKDQKAQGKKTIDTTKPKRMYIKLKTSGRGDKMRVQTPFYGPGDVRQSPLTYLEQRGIITPCIEWDGIYWGGHGLQPHGASLRFFIVEALFVPVGRSDNLPKHRMLPENTAVPDESWTPTVGEDDAPAGSDEGTEEGTFAAPSKTKAAPGAKSQTKALAVVAKANATAKAKTKPSATPSKGKVVAPTKPSSSAEHKPSPKAKVAAPKAPVSKVASTKVAPAKAKAKVVSPKVTTPSKAKAKVKPAPPPEVEEEQEVVEDGEGDANGEDVVEDQVEEDEVDVEEVGE